MQPEIRRHELVAGVDIGGTKTRIVTSRGGRILADEIMVTRDWRTGGNLAGAAALVARIASLAAPASLAALAIGAHGCDSVEECHALETHLGTLLPMRVRVVNDAELLVPAAGLDRGMGVVVGTGSIAVARLGDGTMLTAGGWGWILGDEGSAPALVREAARAVRRAADSAEPRDPLHDALLASFGIAGVTELGRTLDRIRSAATIGAHAPAIFDAADAGSALARRIIRDAGRFLTELVRRVASRGARVEQVVAGGGVIEGQPALFTAFEDEMHRAFPEAVVRLLRKPPVLGAVFLAERLLDGRSVGPLGERAVPSLHGS